ncbi:MAG: T9SS type A sorting domain-containing protein [Saprospiraceae bacterium]|nr:T9SS type A sorting domain-containing protein [Saprospiraceae bacterium]
MRPWFVYTACFFLAFIQIAPLRAQATLLEENFDNCILSPGWEVNINGNPNAVWYVDSTVQNNDNNGQSMNGSCFLFIDDDAAGNQTPAYVIDFVSPPFNTLQYPTVELSLDVHYRDWPQANEYFEVLVTDGTTETPLRRFDQTSATGSNLTQFVTLKYDLSLIAPAANLRLILRYDDDGGFCWWAGVDNISVVGKGVGTNVIGQNFNACDKPAGWETQIMSGDDDWLFGKATASGSAIQNSIDGSCMVYFDDDNLGDSAAYSRVRLLSPWFDGTDFGQFQLEFDLIYRYYTDFFSVYVINGDGEESLVQQWTDDVGGPYFNTYLHQSLDLSPYRSKEMRVVFEYDDANQWGWWVGLDNVKIIGNGAANDLCANAHELLTGAECIPGDNRNAVFDGPQPLCVEKASGGLWFRWQADFTGVAQLATSATFNDVVDVFTGGCQSLTTYVCDNYDEHGFIGEKTRFDAAAGTQYLIRVSGQEGGFGRSRGDLCIEIDPTNDFPTAPANDDCANAVPLGIATACVEGSNRNATLSTSPSLNTLARADIWYKFTAPNSALPFTVFSNANFSDIITLYSGGCDNLTELAGNHKGQRLEMPALTPGETYYLQVAGNFATVEGEVCMAVATSFDIPPPNFICEQATPVVVGGACVAGDNSFAYSTGYHPSCVVDFDHAIWYSFVAPASGSVQFNTGATFEHVLSIWTGDCTDLSEIACAVNPLRCNGFINFHDLVPGQTYYVQVASWKSPAGLSTGEICLQIADGAAPPPFEALELEVQEQCIDIDLAKLNIGINGGTQPYELLGAADGQQFASGTEYLVVVRDAAGCEQALTGIVDECTEAGCFVTAAFTLQNPLCNGQANGALIAQPSGGAEPYAYIWSNGATTAANSGLNAGVYLLTITDANGCEYVTAQTLIEPTLITGSILAVSHPHQGLSDGSVEIEISGGTGSLSYVWSLNGQAVSSMQNLSNAPAGDYTLVVTDENGCTFSLNVTLTETVGANDPNLNFFAEVIPNPLCDKGFLQIKLPASADLFLALSDAQGRNLHEWSAGTVQDQKVPLDFGDLPAGMYWLKIVAGKDVAVRKVVVSR